jgi:hypothetical protein
MTTTKTEYLLDRIAERLGVPKPVDVAFAPEVSAATLIAALADPAQAKKRLAEFADAAAKARDAVAAAKQAKADHAITLAAIADAQKQHDEKLAGELAAHTLEMQSRTKKLDGREAALGTREKDADALLAELKAEREALRQRVEAIRKAAA